MADNRFTVSLELDNIGPHSGPNRITFSEKVNSNKSIFYATNGTGKSFISRAFRLCAPSKSFQPADEVLTLGQNEGRLSFCIDDGSNAKKLSIDIRRGQAPSVQNNTGLIFHVFNSDYVEENIRPKHYTPNGKIEGYILGKIQIDLTEERTRESSLKREIDSLDKSIDTAIEAAKTSLRTVGVTTSTIEYRAITKNGIRDGLGYAVAESADEIIQQIANLESVPDDLADIAFSEPRFNLQFLDDLKSVLEKEYPESDWDDEFVNQYRAHQEFIESGLGMEHSDDTCPFCKRSYNQDAKDLIVQYKAYRDDRESQIISQLKQYSRSVEALIVEINNQEEQINAASVKVSTIKDYFPSLQKQRLADVANVDSYIDACRQLCDLITRKIGNLKQCPGKAADVIAAVKKACEAIIELQKNNATIVSIVNRTKNASKNERLELRRNLCKSMTIELENGLAQTFNLLQQKQDDLKTLQSEIQDKEQQAKTSKRDKVYDAFMSFLNYFFSGKYQIDQETFQIKFLGNRLGENASSVLSDGEKSIVALCWYLAETHTLVNTESDYDNLFLIIDDPISSMDFNYVYAVAQILRDLKTLFNMERHERVWVLTHNNEFFSIIARNSILSYFYMIKPGSISAFGNKLLMPYENHLLDIAKIADGAEPDHTTGNSIRHVIETISKFENPGVNLETYVSQENTLSKDSCIFSLCQDLSHGNVRMERPYSDDVLRQACKTVISFIDVRYPGQLKNVRS